MQKWAMRHVASIRNRYRVGTDGRTQWDCVALRMSERSVAKFGERDMRMMECVGKEQPCFNGVWLGPVARSNEVYVEAKEGVAPALTERRMGGHERWKQEQGLSVLGATMTQDP